MGTRGFYRTLSVLLVLGLAITLAWPAGPVEQRHREVERRAPLVGRAVRLMTRSAKVTVRPAATDELTAVARLELSSRDNRWLAAAERQFDLELLERGDELVLRLPEDWDEETRNRIRFLHFEWDREYHLEIEVAVPQGTRLAIDHRYGDVELTGVSGAVEARVRSGDIRMSGFSGAALGARHEISSRYGSIDVAWPTAALAPGLDLKTRHGSIDCEFSGQESQEDGFATFIAQGDSTSGATLALEVTSGDLTVRRQ